MDGAAGAGAGAGAATAAALVVGLGICTDVNAIRDRVWPGGPLVGGLLARVPGVRRGRRCVNR